MNRFSDLLVCVDLPQADDVSREHIPETCEAAIERGIWLAKRNSAKLTFFHVTEEAVSLYPEAQHPTDSTPSWGETAKGVLGELVKEAEAEGVRAELGLGVGKSWVEIIRRVLRSGHDFVLAGSRGVSPLKSFFMGGTGIKLLRKCPCPVWITRPQSEGNVRSILVPHCLRPVGDLALELSCSMAKLRNAQLHVLHSLEFPELDYAFPARVSAEKSARYREEATRHIQTALSRFDLELPPQVHILTERPYYAILKHIEQHNIDLVVMGTIARTGIPGFITGNTAEKVLPQVPCSLIAVKPDGFSSPVTI